MSEKVDGNKLLQGYEGNFSDSGFWDKVKDVALKAGAKVIYYALLLYYTATADTTSTTDKIMIFSALGYFILPIDLVPDFIPIAGYADDLAALIACYVKVTANITPEIRKQADGKMKEWFPDVDTKKLIE
ncbi:MAG: YkvA family protein [Bacteroidales bacterium]|nr:YkvA family protein [Bacteroidales bacterium]